MIFSKKPKKILERLDYLKNHHVNEILQYQKEILYLLRQNNEFIVDILQERLQERDLGHYYIETDHPIAIDSNDFIYPRGAKVDNTRCLRFVKKIEELFGRKITHLDLGCAGGGLTYDFLLCNHESFGIEGSNYPLLYQSGMWRLIPSRLFTADVTYPFQIRDNKNKQVTFDLITAWELLEHLKEERVGSFLENILKSLKKKGLFIASIATQSDFDKEKGIEYHQCIKDKEWWYEIFAKHGLYPAEDHSLSINDFVRGSENPMTIWDYNAGTETPFGFHAVLEYK